MSDCAPGQPLTEQLSSSKSARSHPDRSSMMTRHESAPFPGVPPQPGTYVLIVRIPSTIEVQVGKLGVLTCPIGWALYVGSARGPGGLAARLARHQRRSKRIHWHVDYLWDVAHLEEVWWMTSARRWECAWAEMLGRFPGMSVPLPGFGASDCRCRSHLFFTRHRPPLAWAHQLPGEGTVHWTGSAKRGSDLA